MPRLDTSYWLRGFFRLLINDTEFRLLVIVATSLWIYSSLIKFPFSSPSNYNDVGYLWIRDVYNGHHNLQIPYVQYELEYPQVIGAVILIGQAISTYFPFILDQWNTFVVVESLIQYPFMVGTVFNLYLLCGKLQLSRTRLYLYMLTTLTFIVYGFYNWDFIVAYFTSLCIWLYLDKRYDASSLALTAAALTKFIPGIMIFPMLWSLPNWPARIRFFLISAVTWIAVNAPFAVANFNTWVKLFIGYSGPNHQLQNTWISWVISLAGLGDIISGARAGQFLSAASFLFLLILALRSNRTPLEKILLTWYAWYGVIYLFDPQMFIQLFPIVILTPNFNFLIYRLADLMNALIILVYFLGSTHPNLPRYLIDQLTPFGLVNMNAALRQLIFLAGYFTCFNPQLQKRLKRIVSLVARLFGHLGSIAGLLVSPVETTH